MTDHPFIGNAYCAVDGAGRLTLPPFVRSTLSRRSAARLIFVGCHDSDPCLVGYDRSFARTLAMDCRRQRLRAEAGAEGQWNARIRRAFGFVEQVELDTRGKVMLPPMMIRRRRHRARRAGHRHRRRVRDLEPAARARGGRSGPQRARRLPPRFPQRSLGARR